MATTSACRSRTRAPDGKTRLRLAPQPHLSGDNGGAFFFPGVLFSAGRFGLRPGRDPGTGRVVPIATLDMRIDHLAPATMDADLSAEAECYRMTRTVAFTRCELMAGPASKLVAIVMGTFMLSSSTPRAMPCMTPAIEPDDVDPQRMREHDRPRRSSRCPICRHLGIRLSARRARGELTFHLPFDARLIGNASLPAIHGGVLATFMQAAALTATSAALGNRGAAQAGRFLARLPQLRRAGGPVCAVRDAPRRPAHRRRRHPLLAAQHRRAGGAGPRACVRGSVSVRRVGDAALKLP